MTYQEFKDYIITHLWKQGDAVVIAALDTIIRTAEAELNRDFKVEDRIITMQLQFPHIDFPDQPHRCPLPADYRELRALYSTVTGEYKYVTPSLYADAVAAGSKAREYTIYNTDTVGPAVGLVDHSGTVATPILLNCRYYRNIPFFASLPVGIVDSWLADRYLDVYLYTVLKHTAPFLREDERLQTWGAMQSSAIVSAMTENLDRKYAGSPLKMKFGRKVR